MKAFLSLAFAVAVLGVSALVAAELKSGLQPGDQVGAFEVEKCAGASADGKEVGDNFCYRCMLGNKPVVMVFARNADERLAGLVKELDKTLPKHKDAKLASFVNMIGSDSDALKAKAKQFGAENKLQNVAIVVPQDNENGPAEFKISPEAEVTVILYREGTVKKNHAFGPGKLDKAAIEKVVSEADELVKN